MPSDPHTANKIPSRELVIPLTSSLTKSEILTTIPSDGGPIYSEPHLGYFFVEPFNAASAGLLLVLVIYWSHRLWPERQKQRFVLSCLVFLAIGGIGGSLYHAFRSSFFFMLLDVLPVIVLAFLVSLFFWRRVVQSALTICSIWIPCLAAQRWIFRLLPRHLAWSIGIVTLATLIAIPLVVYLRRTKYRDSDCLLTCAILFLLALCFRTMDPYSGPYLSIGTHWLWHALSACAAHYLIDYIQRAAKRPPVYREASTPPAKAA